MNIQRFHPDQDRNVETIAQILDVRRRLPSEITPLFVFDAGHNSAIIATGLVGSKVDTLTRVRHDRVFRRDVPPPVPGGPRPIGRPRKHGEALRCADLDKLPKPDRKLVTKDARSGATIVVSDWGGVHPQPSSQQPIVSGHLIVVQRISPEQDDGTQHRNMPALRLFWVGDGVPDLDLDWQAYYHRFDIEHTFRFCKHTLGWTVPSLETPEQAERWTDVVTAAYTQLRLGRGLVSDARLPWQRPADPDHLTPGRVRRGFSRVAHQLIVPTTALKLVKPGIGWEVGRKRQRKQKFLVVRKGS